MNPRATLHEMGWVWRMFGRNAEPEFLGECPDHPGRWRIRFEGERKCFRESSYDKIRYLKNIA